MKPGSGAWGRVGVSADASSETGAAGRGRGSRAALPDPAASVPGAPALPGKPLGRGMGRNTRPSPALNSLVGSQKEASRKEVGGICLVPNWGVVFLGRAGLLAPPTRGAHPLGDSLRR